jgi:cobalt transporter subunit CbtA
MFRSILLSASIAGLFAALVFTALQLALVTPLILQAETYEDAASATQEESTTAVNEHAGAEHTHSHEHADDHHHDANDWKPHDGWQRISFTLISNIVMGVAYGLILAGVYTLWRHPRNTAQGLLFGIAGFAVFFAAPGLGLPPELPGTAAAALENRQMWWIATAIATAISLALFFAQKNWPLRALGFIILVIPHIVGAPHPDVAGSVAPEQLQKHFVLATVASNAVFWLLLGAVSAITWRKFFESKIIDNSTVPLSLRERG